MSFDPSSIPGWNPATGSFDWAAEQGSAGGQTEAVQAVAQAAPPPSAASGSVLGDERWMWAPDFSNVIDISQFPNAFWNPGETPSTENSWQTTPGQFMRKATAHEVRRGEVPLSSVLQNGQYIDATPVGTWERQDMTDGGQITVFDRPTYSQLKGAGLWDLSSPDSPTWDFLGTRASGDPMQDPQALINALLGAGVYDSFWQGPYGLSAGGADYNRPIFENDLRESLAGLPTEFVDQFTSAAGEYMRDYWVDLASQSDDFFGDLLKFEKHRFGNVLDAWKDRPLQAALGINTPLDAKVWNSVTGEDFEPTVNMWGGPTEKDVQSAAQEGIDLEPGMLANAIAGMIASSFAGGALTSGIGRVGAGAVMGGGSAALNGEDWRRGAVRGALGGAAGGAVSDAGSAPSFEPVQVADAGAVMPSAVPEFDATFGGLLTETAPGVFENLGNAASFGSLSLSGTAMPPAIPESDPTFGGDLGETEPGVFESPTPAPASGSDLLQGAQRIAKIARAVGSLFGDGAPADAPVRAEGQSDEQYIYSLAEYMGVDLSGETLAAAGLTVGTPEYYEYIMAQADAVIAQALQGVDVDAEDLASQFRSKSEQEMLQLRRALYVRGQLDTLVGSGVQTDPFTGIGEEVLAGEGGVNPSVAAHQRGLARSVQDLSGLQGGEALDRVRGMLGREADLFGMQAAQDQRFEQAKLQQMEDERRKRGMLSF